MTISKRLILTASVALFATCIWAQEDASIAKQSPHDRIVAASETGLGGASVKNWHLKIDATAIAEKTKAETSGTIEVWHTPDAERTLYEFAGQKRLEIRTAGKLYRNDSPLTLPAGIAALLQAVMNPGPKLSDIDASQPQLTHETFTKTPFDCIMLAQPLKKLSDIPLGLFPTYCLLRNTNDLRVTYDFGSQSLIIRSEGNFGGRTVPLSLSLSEGTREVAHGKVVELKSYLPTADEFTPAPDMHEAGTHLARISSGMVAGLKIGGPPPVYPASARENHISGTVTMHAIIGREGHIHSLRIVSSPDASLAIAAIAAVRQWTYRPYLLNGEPAEVDTIIVVNFNLGPG